MFGANNYIIVTVVNATADSEKKPTNFFDQSSTIMNAALNSVQASMGNQHAQTNIQKQAYAPEVMKTVRAAFGATGTNFETHTPYINGKQIGLGYILIDGVELILVKNGLDLSEALLAAAQHKVIPMRTNSIMPNRLTGNT